MDIDVVAPAFERIVDRDPPRAIVAKINAEAMRVLKQPEIVQRLKAAGYEAAAENSPEQFADFIKAELAKWTKVVKESGARVD